MHKNLDWIPSTVESKYKSLRGKDKVESLRSHLKKIEILKSLRNKVRKESISMDELKEAKTATGVILAGWESRNITKK